MEEFIGKNNLNTFVSILGESSDVPEQLMKAKIGVLSSDMEGLPMALLEYGMAGLPVVVTDVGQCSRVVGDHGLIVPANDSEALSNALSAFVKDEQMRHMAASNFQDQVMETYSWKAVSEKFLKLYKDILV